VTAPRENKEFELRGINHLALVCRDMARTVDFYTNVLGMPLTKTIDLPRGMGQHFFFDIGNGDSLAFFWFPDAPEAAPGIAAPDALVGRGSLVSAHGSMNHVAFDVPAEKIADYRDRLIAKGIEVTELVNHDNSPAQVSRTMNDDVFVRSIYFFDPDGILLEFASWTKELGPDEVRHTPATEADRDAYLTILTQERRS
jgi:catechol 2,3-dioxygenase-like lactoylglutathione lyase family enzyme